MVSKPLMCVIQMLNTLQTLAWGRRTTDLLYHFVMDATGQVVKHNMECPNEHSGMKLGLVDMLWLCHYGSFGKKRTTKQLGNLCEQHYLRALGGTITHLRRRRDMLTRLMLATLFVVVGTTGSIIGIAYLLAL